MGVCGGRVGLPRAAARGRGPHRAMRPATIPGPPARLSAEVVLIGASRPLQSEQVPDSGIDVEVLQGTADNDAPCFVAESKRFHRASTRDAAISKTQGVGTNAPRLTLAWPGLHSTKE